MMQYRTCGFLGNPNVFEDVEKDFVESLVVAVNTLWVRVFYIYEENAFSLQAKAAVLKLKQDYPEIKLYRLFSSSLDAPLETDDCYDGCVFLLEGKQGSAQESKAAYRNFVVETIDCLLCYLYPDSDSDTLDIWKAYSKKKNKGAINCAKDNIARPFKS